MRVSIVALLLLIAAPALAQSVSTLAARDQERIQQVLEFEQTNQPVTLPDSGAQLTIVRTETQPRVCRYFEISGRGATTQGVGCRIGNRQWELRPVANTISTQPTQPVYATPRPDRDSSTSRPPTAGAPTTTASLPGQTGSPTVSLAPPTSGAPTVSVPRTPQPTVITPTPPTTVITPSPPAQAPAPPASQVPAAAPTQPTAAVDPDDFPVPERRPGDPLPLAAAPEAIRTVPRPDVPPRPDTAGPSAAAAGTTVAELSTAAPGPTVAEGDTDLEEERPETREVLDPAPTAPRPARPPGRSEPPATAVGDTVIVFETADATPEPAAPSIADATTANATRTDATNAVPARDLLSDDEAAVQTLLDQFRADSSGSVPGPDEIMRATGAGDQASAPPDVEPSAPDGTVLSAALPFNAPLPPRITRAPGSARLPSGLGGDEIPTPSHRPAPPL